MGLLDRINDERDQYLVEQAADQLVSDRIRADQLAAVNQIIQDALRGLAGALGEQFEVIVENRVFGISDVVILVENMQRHSREVPDPSNPGLVVWEYRVYLVGVDKRSGRLDKFTIGALKFLRYESFYQAVTQAPTYLDVRAGEVLLHRDELARL